MRILQANPSDRENATGFRLAVTLRQRSRDWSAKVAGR
jgi:hypothetical protein